MAKILVVDDEHLTLEMLSAFLRMIGHNPITALNGRQTWDKLAYEDPEIILLDIMLPDTTGIQILKDLRADAKHAHVPVIMISAHAPPMIAEAAAAGANGYLTKPINLEQLKKTLMQASVSK